MTTESDILAVLMGRKEFAARVWRVYDSGGIEIADPGGVLWRGVHGALLWNINLISGDRQPRGMMLFGRMGDRNPR